MADRTHDLVDPADEELLAISAALDGEGPPPARPSARGDAFGAATEQLRRRARVTEAEPVPDLTDAVLADLGTDAVRRSRRRTIASVAAAFVIGALVSAAFLLDRDLDAPDVAASDLTRELVRAQARLTALDAELTIVERGVHPDVPERTYAGALTYESPERLAVSIVDVTVYPGPAWVPNDVDIVVDDDVAWRTRGLGCPVDALPDCLGPVTVDAIVGRAPFSEGWAAPLDLIVPAGDLIEDDVHSETRGDRVVVTTTVRGARSLVDAVTRAGAFRQVHATDVVVIELDRATLGLRRLEIRASGASSRALWATTWGYTDPVDAMILELELREIGTATPIPGTPPVAPLLDAGFHVGPVDERLVPTALPEGLAPHRRGTQVLPGGRVDEIATWSDGRAWVSVRSSAADGLRPSTTSAQAALANGVAYVDRVEAWVDVFADGRRFRITGSLPIGTLTDVAGRLPVTGEEAADGAGPDLPGGALVPGDVHSVMVAGDDVTIVTAADDGSVVTLRQRPGELLPPPLKTDSFEVPVRSTTGRWSATLGRLTWLEDGRVLELHSADADLEELLALATSLRPAA